MSMPPLFLNTIAVPSTPPFVKKQAFAFYAQTYLDPLFFLFFYSTLNRVLHDLQLGKGWLEGVAQPLLYNTYKQQGALMAP